jgi:hypothetical protein
MVTANQWNETTTGEGEAIKQAAAAAASAWQGEQQRRELMRVLSKTSSLVTLVADTQQFDLRQACRITKLALEEDPDFDKKLVELTKSPSLTAEQVIRVLAILESVCTAPRLLGHILGLKHLEGRVRSKLTLMIGRLTGDPQWLRAQLADENPRVRANAIEGIWDVRAPGLDELLLKALRDPNQRVAANAALGLHKIGQVAAVESLHAMLRKPDELFRRAALWAIGQSRDPRFLAAVEEVAGSARGEEGVAAQRVREELRTSRASSEFTSAPSLEVSGDRILSSGTRCVTLCCLAEAATGWLGEAEINALNFEIIEGERPMEDYHLNWLVNDMPLTALVVVPRSWNGSGELLRPALLGAGALESYGFLPYQTPYSPIRGNEHDDAVEVNFGRYVEVSKNYLAHRYYVARSLGFAIQAGLGALVHEQGKKHIFVLADPSVGDAAPPAEISSLESGGTQIHAAVWENARAEFCDALKELALKSGGRFVPASSAREFTRTILAVRAAQFGSFELSWKPRLPGPKAPVRIVCHSNYGYGEVLLKKPA